MDLLIIGAGLSGAVVANRIAHKNKKVIVYEKKSHVGGHIYDKKIDGIMCHAYGPHVFHTNKQNVAQFMENFWILNDFKIETLCYVKDKIIPLPFNFVGIELFFPEQSLEIKNLLSKKYQLNSRVTIVDLLNDKNKLVKQVANFVYENIFENYTTKMWGTDATKISKSVLKRVPITIGYGTRYFSDHYEGIPQDGYTKTIEKMLNHPNINVVTNKNIKNILKIENDKIYLNGQIVNYPVVYTGPIDELFNYKFGILEYRSLNIVFETLNIDSFQAKAVVNYPAHPTMTRIAEYKKMTNSTIKDRTVISYEYPGKFAIDSKIFNNPYYPMMTVAAKAAYEKYFDEAKKIKNLYLVGRLATFKYINMDEAIDLALQASALIATDMDQIINLSSPTSEFIEEKI